MQMKNKRVY